MNPLFNSLGRSNETLWNGSIANICFWNHHVKAERSWCVLIVQYLLVSEIPRCLPDWSVFDECGFIQQCNNSLLVLLWKFYGGEQVVWVHMSLSFLFVSALCWYLSLPVQLRTTHTSKVCHAALSDTLPLMNSVPLLPVPALNIHLLWSFSRIKSPFTVHTYCSEQKQKSGGGHSRQDKNMLLISLHMNLKQNGDCLMLYKNAWRLRT